MMTASTTHPEQYEMSVTEPQMLIATLQKNVAFLAHENSWLKEQLADLQRRLFGQSADKPKGAFDPYAMYLPGCEPPEHKDFEKPNDPEPRKRTLNPNNKGQDSIRLPVDTPVKITIIDIPESEKICKVTGEKLVKIGEEITEKLRRTRSQWFIERYIRPKYASSGASEEGVKTAPLPNSLLDRCQADESLLADIVTQKFADHLPLYRIAEIYARENVHISRQLLSQWLIKSCLALAPIYEEMKKQVRATGNVFIDETPVDMLSPGKGKTLTCYMWVMVGGREANPPYRIYEFFKNRKHENLETLLKDFQGGVHSDKYGAYAGAAERQRFIWYPCWAHVRRKFTDLESGDQELVKWVIEKIDKLFDIDAKAWTLSAEERLTIRQEQEVPIIDELIEKISNRRNNGAALPKSKFAEALNYFCGLIPHLKNYTQHPYARLDNNPAERAIRPLTIGRKNWLFVGSEESGRAAAIALTLIQTCRALDINPREYLEDVMRRVQWTPYTRIHELLPDEWLKARQRERPPPDG